MHTHRLNANAAATACAVVTAIGFILCVLAYLVAPEATIAFFALFFHGIELRKLYTPLTLGGTVGSFVLWVVSAYLATWVWVALYNRFLGGGAGSQEGSSCCKA